jgi:hypothetical protein
MVGGTQTGDKVIFKCENCAFCGVASMEVWRGKLEYNVGFIHEGLQSQGGFIFHAFEKGFESMRFKILDSLLVCGNDEGACAIYHGLQVYGIAIVFIDNTHVLMAGDAGCEKYASGVSVNHASGGIAVRVQVSCASGRWFGRCCVDRGVVTSGLLL